MAGARRVGVGPRLGAYTGQRQFHTPVLRPTLRRVVRGHGVLLAATLPFACGAAVYHRRMKRDASHLLPSRGAADCMLEALWQPYR